jgi:hypothetical protein
VNGEPTLRITRRCLIEDLEFGEADVGLPLEELAQRHPMVRAFLDKRSQQGAGQETIQGLRSKIVAYSLHAGEDRGVTWHHEAGGVVWLLAAHFHRSGKPDDAYPYFRQLDAKGLLLPLREDYEALTRSQVPVLARSLLTDVPRILREAQANHGIIISAAIGGRVRVRLLEEGGLRPMQTVAISMQIQPGEMALPPDWMMIVVAAFFSGLPADDLHSAFDIGGRMLGPDEVAFCNFVPLGE